MWKFELRKLAVVTLALSVGLVTACTSSSSSTNDAIAHPGPGYMGTIQVDVNPQAGTVDMMEVGSAYTTVGMPGDGAGNIPNVTISSSNAVWNGTDTMDFDATVAWDDTLASLFNVRMGVNFSTDLNVKIIGGDIADNTLWSDPSTTPGGGTTDPAYTFVSDSSSDGPETVTLCSQLPVCVSSNITNIHEECGSVTTHFALVSSATPYQFWMNLWGDKVTTVAITADPRYDVNTNTIFIRTYGADPLDATFPAETAAQTTFAQGEWFYAHYYVDVTGANRALPFSSSATVGPTRIEDTGNLAAWGGGASSTANYWYMNGGLPYSLRWDPAVVNVFANDIGGGIKFTTAGGTKFYTINDADLGAVDGHNARTDPYTTSNSMAVFLQSTGKHTSGTYFYPIPGNGADGFANLDWDAGILALQAIGPPGSGSPIKIAYNSQTFFAAYRTESSPYNSADDFGANMERSTNWPDWFENMVNGGFPGPGQYNAERHHICVQ